MFAGSKQRAGKEEEQEKEEEEEGALKQDIGGNRTCGVSVSTLKIKTRLQSTIKRRLKILPIDHILGLIMDKEICLDRAEEEQQEEEQGNEGQQERYKCN